ncbi:MAG: hypothetical protein DRP10_02430 [Candidatus Aenigmatarchaeota archaeon]|nr:MAG: hypothetical protein DRP10_02430 [Candidatus Aenigmarchaeota archaeon]
MLKNILEDLYSLTKERFLEEFFKLGFNKKDFEDLEKKLSKDSSDMNIRALFSDILIRIIEKRKVKNLKELNNFVREFQALTNHFVIYLNSKKLALSNFIITVLMTEKEIGSKKSLIVDEFMKVCCDAHKEINQFLKSEYGQLGPKEKEIISIAHHILDWYLQVKPDAAYKKKSKKLAAISIYLVEKINSKVTGYITTGITAKKLSEFSGYSSSGALSSSANDVFYDVIYNVIDPELLLVEPLKAKNWKEKLKEIAPCLEENFSEYDCLF